MFNWFNFITYAVLATITPGPNNIMSMSNASRLGFRKSFPFNLGIWTGASIVMLASAVFCNTLSGVMPKIKMPMLVIGALYMLWLAWKSFRRSAVVEEKHTKSNYLSGLVFQFINPKICIYGIVTMETYILPYYQGQWGMLICFALLMAVISSSCNLCWSLFGSVFKLLFSKYAKITNTIMGLLLIYCAIALFL